MNEDDRLLGRSARDPEVFGVLVTRHQDALFSYLARRAPDAAPDLLGEVWLRAFASRATFDGERGGARGWLFGVARHVLLSHWRSRDVNIASPGDPSADDDWAAVDARLDAAAVAPRLRAAMADLPPVDREMLLLVAWEQLSPGEAADAVGVPRGTARSRLHRARTAMREHLARRNELLGETSMTAVDDLTGDLA